MSTIEGVAKTAAFLAQSRVRSEVDVRLLKMAQDLGAKQALQLLEQTVATAMEVAAGPAEGRVDTFA